eukprot:EG_transcript_2993
MSSAAFPVLFGAVSRPILITLLSYLLGAFGIIKPTSATGLNDVVSSLLLPSLLLKAMLTMDLSDVQWSILFVIFLSKFILMVFTWALVHAFISNQKLSKIGIYGLFVTLSNDVAVGLPIMQALFPKYQNYLLLVKPQQMLVLNGIGLAILEAAQIMNGQQAGGRSMSPRQNDNGKEGKSDMTSDNVSLFKALVRVFPELVVRLAKNSSLNTVFLGLFVNALFGPKFVPEFLLGALEVAGAGYTGCALVSLGLSMVGKEKVFMGRGLTWPFVLAALKCVALPFLTHALARCFVDDGELLGFFFVYGAIPAGPHAFTFAAQYGASTDVIGGALVLTLFMSTLVTMAGTFRMQAPAELLSEDIADVSSWIALLAVVMVLPMVLIQFTRSLPRTSTSRWLKWLMLSELCFSAVHLACESDAPDGCLLFIRLLHEFFRIQTSVWLCCLAVIMLYSAKERPRDAEAWAVSFHVAAWSLPALLLVPIAHALTLPYPTLKCILRPGLRQSVTSVTALSCFIAVDLYCLLKAQRTRKSRFLAKAEKEVDCTSALRRSSMGGSQYLTMRYKAESASSLAGGDGNAAFLFQVRLVLVCEIINLVFQIIGELGAFFGQRSFFFLPFLFSTLLEQGQPILLFLVFGFDDQFMGYCRAKLKAWGWLRPATTEDGVVDGSGSERDAADSYDGAWPELSYDDLLDLYPDLQPLAHDIADYRQCFLGTEVVDMLVNSRKAMSRAHAVAIGRQLLAYHLIAHVRLERDFEDRHAAYRLTEPDAAANFASLWPP